MAAGRHPKPVKRTGGYPISIRKGDRVEVISGKDRGKQGRVLRVAPSDQRVFVEGLNMLKRHTRPQATPDSQSGPAIGGVIEREGPIHVSNVMLLDPKDGKRTRIGVRRTAGQRVRVARRSGGEID